MCLVIRKNSDPIITTEDIVVYKKVIKLNKEEVMSPFMFFKYVYDVEYTIDSKLIPYRSGLYADEKAALHYEEVLEIELVYINVGFHFAFTKKRLSSYTGTVVTCIIPKGSRMYKDETGFGVSNRIIIKKIDE